MHVRTIVLAIAAIVVLGASLVAAQTIRGDIRNGQLVYAQNCVRCHGEKLDGKGPDGQFLVVAPTNLTSLRSRGKTDWELLLAISHGVVFSPMHGWRDRLTQEQILDVLAYVRMMAPFDSVS